MNRVIDSSRVSPSEATHIGIAIHGREQHIGLLYRVSAGKPALLLHLKSHHRLRSDLPTADYVLWVDPPIPEERAKAVATFSRRIWKMNEAGCVPFGFSQPNEFFDHTGQILTGPAKVGLTCATFVLAVFEQAGLRLVDYETWPPPTAADVERQKNLVKQLEERRVPKEHVEALRREIGNIRYGPHEVAGAATNDTLPSDHAHASRIAKRIRRRLAEIRAAGLG